MFRTISSSLVFTVSGAIFASSVCVTNNGAFQIHWQFENLTRGGLSAFAPNQEKYTTECMDIAIDGLEFRDEVRLVVYAYDGTIVFGNYNYHYWPTPATTGRYACFGETPQDSWFHCEMEEKSG